MINKCMSKNFKEKKKKTALQYNHMFNVNATRDGNH